MPVNCGFSTPDAKHPITQANHYTNLWFHDPKGCRNRPICQNCAFRIPISMLPCPGFPAEKAGSPVKITAQCDQHGVHRQPHGGYLKRWL